MVDPKCATCGQTISPTTQEVEQCELCEHVDVTVVWCNEQCKTKGLSKHKEGKCAGAAGRSIDVTDEESYRHFCTPSCKVRIVTPRLRLRPVEWIDSPRVFKIKNDSLVSRMQLYGTVSSEAFCTSAFVSSYISDTIPCLLTQSSPGASRNRYVFGIEPRILKDGLRTIEPRPAGGAKHQLDSDGYVGNIAVELVNKAPMSGFNSTTRIARLIPKRGEVFTWPDRAEIEDTVEASLFYELHPSFWRQGIMSESLKAITSFIFQALNISSILLDPIESNVASIALAEQHGFKLVGEKRAWTGEKQLLCRLDFDGWKKGRKNQSRKKKKKGNVGTTEEPQAVSESVSEAPIPELHVEADREARKCCRWCQVPTSPATLGCSGCDWAFWCSQACKTADLTFSKGHSLECPSRIGKPSTTSPPKKTIPSAMS
ncbi:GNAT family N-acetyltransferase [Sporobolomyces salmoneus]|uniref:GNAT family N-acetyltransferase n=1 Tax=Sporobolomyces salmoneus TaxID=183962 RepID=UPI00316B5B95